MKLVVSALEGILINVSSVLTLAILLIKELVLDHKYADQEQWECKGNVFSVIVIAKLVLQSNCVTNVLMALIYFLLAIFDFVVKNVETGQDMKLNVMTEIHLMEMAVVMIVE